jgi:hypothetical protein
MLLQCIQFFKYVASRSERALVIDGMVCLLDADVTKCRIAPAASCIYRNRKMVSTIGRCHTHYSSSKRFSTMFYIQAIVKKE